MPTAEKDCPNASLAAKASPNCGQTGHCPTSPRQTEVTSSHNHAPQESFTPSGPGSHGFCPDTPALNAMGTTGTWGNCLDKGFSQVSVILLIPAQVSGHTDG